MQRAPPSSRRFARGLPVALGLAGLVAFVWLGGVPVEARAVVHLLLAAAMLFVAAQPTPVRAALGTLGGPARGWLLLVGAVALALLPLPVALLGLVAPGRLVPEGAALASVSTSVEATLGGLADLLLLAGGYLGGAALALRWRSRRRITGWVLRAALGAQIVVLLHSLLGLDKAFGLLTAARATGGTLLPVVNPNHVAALANLVLPLALEAARAGHRTQARVLGLLVATGSLGLVALSGSRAGLGLAVALIVATLLRPTGEAPRGAWLVVGAVAGGLLALAGLSLQAREGARLSIWEATGRALADHPVLGVGRGTLRTVVDAYRSDVSFVRWEHTHADPLEWLAETGAVGGLALVAAVWLAWPPPAAEPRRRLVGMLSLGLLGLGLHALVDFPLAIPAVLLAGATVAGLIAGLAHRDLQGDATAARRVALVLAAAQLVAAGWRTREAFADAAEHDLRASWLGPLPAPDEAARARLVLFAPGRPALAIDRVLHAADATARLDAAREAVALHPGDADVLRVAGSALATGSPDLARGWLLRATGRARHDWRPWAALARLEGSRGAWDEAAPAWAEAFRRGAPPDRMREAYVTDPSAAAWLARLADAELPVLVALAQIADRQAEPLEAARVWTHIGRRLIDPVPWGASRVRALVTLGQPEEALALAGALVTASPSAWRSLQPAVQRALDVMAPSEAATWARREGPRVRRFQALGLAAVARAEGAPAALDLLRRWRLEGVSADDLAEAEAALHAQVGDARACARALGEGGVRLGADEVRRRCGGE